jgi:hypothetical protein
MRLADHGNGNSEDKDLTGATGTSPIQPAKRGK